MDAITVHIDHRPMGGGCVAAEHAASNIRTRADTLPATLF
jgi:hypothetical protein